MINMFGISPKLYYICIVILKQKSNRPPAGATLLVNRKIIVHTCIYRYCIRYIILKSVN